MVFPFDACSRLSLRSCCLLCLIPPLAPAPAHAPAACSAHSRRFLPAPVARSRSLRSLSPHAPAEFSLPPLVQLPIAPAAQSLLTRRSFHSAPAARPLRSRCETRPYVVTNGATFSLPPTHPPALTRTDHSLMRADDMQACNCWVEEIRIAAASADKLLLSADKLLLSHVSLRRRVQAQPRLAPIPAHRPVSQPRAANDRARSRRSRSCGSRSQGPSSTAPPCSSCSTSSRTSWFQSPAATSPSALSRRTHPPSLRSFRLLCSLPPLPTLPLRSRRSLLPNGVTERTNFNA